MINKKMDYITTYSQAFDLISVRLDDYAKQKIKTIEKEGYSERTISYSIWKSQDKIMKYRDDSRFWSVLFNEVRRTRYVKK